MAHQKTPSSTSGAPHAISLKVLRLSRPSLATQTPLPQTTFGNGFDIPPSASLAYPSADADTESRSSFPLTSLLMLPPAFGAAYVGETFTCTLCANYEGMGGDGGGNGEKRGSSSSVSGVRIAAELQTPSTPNGVALELESGMEDEDKDDDDGGADGSGDTIKPGATLQRTLRHELKEEGQHVLAVTVTYTETLRSDDGGASVGGRARTFRKLYQFVAQQLVAVRSKVTERRKRERGGGRQWILEAQLENVGETAVVLEKVWVTAREGIGSSAVGGGDGGDGRDAAVLKPQDVEQVMFVLGEKEEQAEDVLATRVPLAQLNIDWRSAMGERGSLTTGWLASRGR